MIRLDLNPTAVEPSWVEFPTHTTGTGENRLVPAFLMDAPTLASLGAAQSIAQRALPGRDEGEEDDAYAERLKAKLEGYGALLPEGSLDLQARVEGAMKVITLVAHAQALVRGWRHFGDGDGNEIEPTPMSIRAALRDVVIATTVRDWINGQLLEGMLAGNG